ncbi:hypothetical protein MIDIC_290008 [Alphaproteobacteria bacterium]
MITNDYNFFHFAISNLEHEFIYLPPHFPEVDHINQSSCIRLR